MFWSPHEYRLANSSEKMNSLVCVQAGEERRGSGPDALSARLVGPCYDRALDWRFWGGGLCLNSEISPQPWSLALFTGDPERKSDLFKITDLGGHSGTIMHLGKPLGSTFQSHFPHL